MSDQLQTSRTFDDVSKVIGDEMGKAFRSIMERLATGESAAMTVSKQDLGVFFSQLNGCALGVEFACREDKGNGIVQKAFDLPLSDSNLPGLAVEGSVSIGVSIRF